MADLSVDYEALGRTERALSKIVMSFEAAEYYRDDLEQAWGDKRIAHAMRDFVDNWDRHRRDLLKSVTSVGEMCGEACSTFRALEAALGKTIEIRSSSP